MNKIFLLRAKYVASFAMFTILFVYGCGLKDDIIKINYRATVKPQQIDGANLVDIKIVAIDSRKVTDYVGKKVEQYSFSGHIIAQNDLIRTIEQAIIRELRDRGFKLGGEKVIVSIELFKFINEFKSEGAVAEVILNVLVKNVENKIFFTKLVAEENTHSHVMLLSGSNAKESLEQALQDAVQRIVSDSEFINALFMASKN